MTQMERTLVFRILNHASLFQEYHRIFESYGVDDDTIAEIRDDHLQEMGILRKQHREIILKSRDSVLSEPALPESIFQEEEEKKENITIKNPITVNMLVKSSSASTRSKGQSVDTFLRKFIMVELSDKDIDSIENLENCPKTQVLYLNNNLINVITNLDMLRYLRILSLENNKITQLSGLANLMNLEKLHLDRNYIQIIEGLENLNRLAELHCNFQTITRPLEFEENSIVGISPSLQTLSLSGNKVENIALLWYLDALQELDLSGNQIQIGEDLIKALSCMSSLRTLNLSNNPIVRRPKYRDEIILCNISIEDLDGKRILANEREYLLRLKGKGRTLQPKKPGKKDTDLEIIGSRFRNK